MAVWLALVAALAYGLADFAGGLAARRYTALQVISLSYPVSTLIVLCAMPWAGVQHFSTEALAYSVGSGLALVVAIWCLYAALALGPISIVSPITAVLSAGLPVIVGLVLGETLASTGWAGVLLGMAAIVLVSLHGPADATASPGGRPARFVGRVLGLTVLTGVGFALSYVLTHAIPAQAGLWPVLVVRVVGWGVLLLAGGWRYCRRVARPLWRYALLIGLLDATASTAMYSALQLAQLSTTTVLISLYPVVTVLLALGVLRERLAWQQGVGIALSVLAIALISL